MDNELKTPQQIDAIKISYDNTNSNMTATNVQEAIDELIPLCK